MMTSIKNFPKIFISYSWHPEKHRQRVRDFVLSLESQGIDCIFDEDFSELKPPQGGWKRWIPEQIEKADFVLIIFTEGYERRRMLKDETGGRGVAYEADVIMEELYSSYSQSKKYILVVFDENDKSHIPSNWKSLPTCSLYNEEALENLVQHLKDQPPSNLISTESQQRREEREESTPVKTKQADKQFKRKRKEALITHLAELEPHEISAICVALLKDSEYRNFPKPQPERSHALTSYFERFNRTDELVEHIRKRKPELYKMIEQDMEE